MKRTKYKILALLLIMPMLIRVFLPSSIEQKFIVDNNGISFFVFNLFYLIYFISAPKTNKRKNKIIAFLVIFQWIIALTFSLFTYNYSSTLNFIFTCQNIFIIPYLFFSRPLSQKQIDYLKWPLIIAFSFLSLQIFLYSTGILKFDFGTEKQYGQIIRIANTTIGGITGASIFIFILGSILFDNYISEKRQTLFLFLWSIPIFFSVSRGSIMGFSIFALYVFFRKTGDKTLIKKVGYLLFITFTIIVLYHLNVFNPLIERSYEIEQSSSDYSSGRIDRYKLAYDKFLESPITGNGIATIYKPLEANIENDLSPHNLWLTILAEQGLIGFILQILIIIIISTSINKHTYSFVSFLLIIFVLMNVESIFIYDEYIALLYLFFIISGKKINKNKINIL